MRMIRLDSNFIDVSRTYAEILSQFRYLAMFGPIDTNHSDLAIYTYIIFTNTKNSTD